MKWTVLNAFGGLAWLAGLSFAKGAPFLKDDLLTFGDHRVMVGIGIGMAGLMVLLWTNIRNAA